MAVSKLKEFQNALFSAAGNPLSELSLAKCDELSRTPYDSYLLKNRSAQPAKTSLIQNLEIPHFLANPQHASIQSNPSWQQWCQKLNQARTSDLEKSPSVLAGGPYGYLWKGPKETELQKLYTQAQEQGIQGDPNAKQRHFELWELKEHWRAWAEISDYQKEEWQALAPRIDQLQKLSEAELVERTIQLQQDLIRLEFGKMQHVRVTGLLQAQEGLRKLERFENFAASISQLVVLGKPLPQSANLGLVTSGELELKIREYEAAFDLYQSGEIEASLQAWTKLEQDGFLVRLADRQFYGELEMLVPELAILYAGGWAMRGAERFLTGIEAARGIEFSSLARHHAQLLSFVGVTHALHQELQGKPYFEKSSPLENTYDFLKKYLSTALSFAVLGQVAEKYFAKVLPGFSAEGSSIPEQLSQALGQLGAAKGSAAVIGYLGAEFSALSALDYSLAYLQGGKSAAESALSGLACLKRALLPIALRAVGALNQNQLKAFEELAELAGKKAGELFRFPPGPNGFSPAFAVAGAKPSLSPHEIQDFWNRVEGILSKALAPVKKGELSPQKKLTEEIRRKVRQETIQEFIHGVKEKYGSGGSLLAAAFAFCAVFQGISFAVGLLSIGAALAAVTAPLIWRLDYAHAFRTGLGYVQSFFQSPALTQGKGLKTSESQYLKTSQAEALLFNFRDKNARDFFSRQKYLIALKEPGRALQELVKFSKLASKMNPHERTFYDSLTCLAELLMMNEGFPSKSRRYLSEAFLGIIEAQAKNMNATQAEHFIILLTDPFFEKFHESLPRHSPYPTLQKLAGQLPADSPWQETVRQRSRG